MLACCEMSRSGCSAIEISLRINGLSITMTSPNIISVEARANYELVVRWADGSTTTHDLSQTVNNKAWAAPLRDPATFGAVVIQDAGRGITWPPTDIEYSADGLWDDEHPRQAAPRWMSAEQFRGWLGEMAFTWDEAAEALGVSRRTIGYYSNGEQEIPKAIWLSCMHIAAERSRANAMLKRLVTHNVNGTVSFFQIVSAQQTATGYEDRAVRELQGGTAAGRMSALAVA